MNRLKSRASLFVVTFLEYGIPKAQALHNAPAAISFAESVNGQITPLNINRNLDGYQDLIETVAEKLAEQYKHLQTIKQPTP